MKDTSTMNNWAVGHNLPGYMPESDVYITSDWQQAREVLIEDIERHADSLAEITDSEFSNPGDGDSLRAADDSIRELRELREPTEYLTYVDGLAYWINATDEELDEEE